MTIFFLSCCRKVSTLELASRVSTTSKPSDGVPDSSLTATSLARTTTASLRLLLCSCSCGWQNKAARLDPLPAPDWSLLDFYRKKSVQISHLAINGCTLHALQLKCKRDPTAWEEFNTCLSEYFART